MMKRLFWICTLLLLLGITAVEAQEEVNWYSIDEAIQLAAEEPRVLVIDVYTDWCGWCKRMDAITFSDPEVARTLNSQFYPVKLDAEGKQDIVIGDRSYQFVESGRNGYHELAAIVTRGRLSYSTVSYVDERGRVLEASPGFQNPGQFKVQLAYYANEAYKTQSFEDFSASYLD